jgi:bacterioferritin (cytochrome b1)
MTNLEKELIEMLNQALRLEHTARIQYLTHSEMIKGENAEKLIERLKEIASDEEKHESKFRSLISNYLNGEPVMDLAETHRATELKNILEINLKGEKDAIDYYKKIYQKVTENRSALQYTYETLEHEIRHVIVDEQEHVTELSLLLGK